MHPLLIFAEWHIHHRLNVYTDTIELRRYCDGGGATTRQIGGGRSVWGLSCMGVAGSGLWGYGAE